MENLNKLSKKELINTLSRYIGVCKHQKNVICRKMMQIRHFRVRIKKVRDSMDYLLIHPFSKDSSNKRRKRI